MHKYLVVSIYIFRLMDVLSMDFFTFKFPTNTYDYDYVYSKIYCY